MRRHKRKTDHRAAYAFAVLLAWLAVCAIAAAMVCHPSETPKTETREIPIVYDTPVE